MALPFFDAPTNLKQHQFKGTAKAALRTFALAAGRADLPRDVVRRTVEFLILDATAYASEVLREFEVVKDRVEEYAAHLGKNAMVLQAATMVASQYLLGTVGPLAQDPYNGMVVECVCDHSRRSVETMYALLVDAFPATVVRDMQDAVQEFVWYSRRPFELRFPDPYNLPYVALAAGMTWNFRLFRHQVVEHNPNWVKAHHVDLFTALGIVMCWNHSPFPPHLETDEPLLLQVADTILRAEKYGLLKNLERNAKLEQRTPYFRRAYLTKIVEFRGWHDRTFPSALPALAALPVLPLSFCQDAELLRGVFSDQVKAGSKCLPHLRHILQLEANRVCMDPAVHSELAALVCRNAGSQANARAPKRTIAPASTFRCARAARRSRSGAAAPSSP